MKQVRDADILSVVTIHIILAAARILLLARGYSETTLDDIAHAAQTRSATVLYYFDSKEHIYASVLREDLGALLKTLRESDRPGDSPLTRLLAAHDATARFLADYRHVEGLRMLTDAILSQASLDRPGSAPAIIRRGGAERAGRIVAHFQGILDEGMARGHFRAMDTRLGAGLQLGISFGCACPLPFSIHGTGTPIDDAEMRRVFRDLIASGVLNQSHE